VPVTFHAWILPTSSAQDGKGKGDSKKIDAANDLVVEVAGTLTLKLPFLSSLVAARKEAVGLASALLTPTTKNNRNFREVLAAVVGLTAKSAYIDTAIPSASALGGDGEGIGLVVVGFRLQVVHRGRLRQCKQVTTIDQTLMKIESLQKGKEGGDKSMTQQADMLEQELVGNGKASKSSGKVSGLQV
jgi:hypothetical protein